MTLARSNPIENGLLFFGNQHETVPVQLLYDTYLTPRAKYAWQIIKSRAREFSDGIFPSYDALALMLSDKPYSNAKLSRKVITQTLLALRLTRWLTLAETVRSHSGQIVGNVYILHDEPMPILDALQLDEHYLVLLEKCSKHRDPIVHGIANHIIDNVLQDDTQWHYLSHLDWIRHRYEQFNQRQRIDGSDNVVTKTDEILQSSIKELGHFSRELSQKSSDSLSSIKELRHEKARNSLNLARVPLGNSDKQYSTSTCIYKYSTSTHESQDIQLPKNICLTEFEQKLVLKKLQGLTDELREAVCREAETRVERDSKKIRSPKAYFLNLIKLAQQGNFNPYLSRGHEQPIAKSSEAHEETSTSEMARKINTHTTTHVRAELTEEERELRLQQIRSFSQRILLN